MSSTQYQLNKGVYLRNNVIKLFIILISIIGIVYFVRDAQLNNQKLELKNIEVQDTSSELKLLQGKYDVLNTKLEKARGDEKRIKKLEKEQTELQKEKQRLESELQAKLERKRLAQASQSGNAVHAGAVSGVPVSGDCASWMASAGISDIPRATTLIGRESGCQPCIVNGGTIDCNYSGNRAYGIPQALPGHKMASAGADWKTNPITQLRWMESYVQGRYQGWAGAIAHSDAKGWY